MFTHGPGRLDEVPGFSGYFVGPSNEIYSCHGPRLKILTTFRQRDYARPGKPEVGRPLVQLQDDRGEPHRLYVHAVVKLAVGPDEAARREQRRTEQRRVLRELF